MRLECPECHRLVYFYNPRVGANRQTRLCEHNANGLRCFGSNQPVARCKDVEASEAQQIALGIEVPK